MTVDYGSLSKPTSVPAVNSSQPNENGRKTFHPNRISWSNRYRGLAARAQINSETKNTVLIPIHRGPGTRVKGKQSKGGSQPPLNNKTVKILMRIMLAYSPKKNLANPKALYSTLYPATSSASASGRSKGGRFVSASAETKKSPNIGSIGKMYHVPSPPCASTSSVRFSVPAQRRTAILMNPMDTSYEIIWAAERMAPRKAYFEFDAHPAMMIPYTASELMANRYLIPRFTSASTIPSPNGMTAYPSKLSIKVITGAARNSQVLAFDGTTDSLANSFRPSARG